MEEYVLVWGETTSRIICFSEQEELEALKNGYSKISLVEYEQRVAAEEEARKKK